MYRFEWFERFRLTPRPALGGGRLADVSPVVLALGLTSFLTDISSEMVGSVLPAYLVLHLHLSPAQYGAIDGIYNGLAAMLAGVAAGWFADRTRRHKEVAAAGYAVSAACKLLLLAAGAAWGWILLVTGLDRIGKGIRTAPRDALISLHSSGPWLATAFGVHRAMDAAGAMLGPLLAFALLTYLPRGFDALWMVSFVFAFLGMAALWLFVPRTAAEPARLAAAPAQGQAILTPRFTALLIVSTLLAAATVSDGFIYLFLQQKSGVAAGFVPLFFMVTAAAYMVFAIPAAWLADRAGRGPVMVLGYAVLMAVYGVLLFVPTGGIAALVGCLVLLGLYYAGTQGVILALASSILPAERRALGLAVIVTGIGGGKVVSSVVFGWVWQGYGVRAATAGFALALLAAAAASMALLRRQRFL